MLLLVGIRLLRVELRRWCERTPDQGADPAQGLKKGMSREQVEALYGKAVEAHDHTENGMTITSCTFTRQG